MRDAHRVLCPLGTIYFPLNGFFLFRVLLRRVASIRLPDNRGAWSTHAPPLPPCLHCCCCLLPCYERSEHAAFFFFLSFFFFSEQAVTAAGMKPATDRADASTGLNSHAAMKGYSVFCLVILAALPNSYGMRANQK